MPRNLKSVVINNREYVWNNTQVKSHIIIFSTLNGIKKEDVYYGISEKINIMVGDVKGWFGKQIGPDELDDVHNIADYLGLKYENLLTEIGDGNYMFLDGFFSAAKEARKLNGSNPNLNNIKFISVLNELARGTQEGISSFWDYRNSLESTNIDKSNDSNMFGVYVPGIIYISEVCEKYGKIVRDMCVDNDHEIILSTYDEYIRDCLGLDYNITINDDSADELFIEVTGEDGLHIAIHDGKWYACE